MSHKRIYLYDEHVDKREQLCELLRVYSEIEVCGCGGTMHEAIPQIENLNPDIILFEVKMHNRKGIEMFKKIRNRFSKAKLIVATSYADSTEEKQVAQLGADGYWDFQQGVRNLRKLISG